jgi:hypothetical protein
VTIDVAFAVLLLVEAPPALDNETVLDLASAVSCPFYPDYLATGVSQNDATV